MVRKISLKNTCHKNERMTPIPCSHWCDTPPARQRHKYKEEHEGRTSICIFRCTLKCDSNVRKMASESSKTSGTEETPFLERATHRYCLMALTNMSCVRKMGPAACSTDSSSWSDTTLERSSWDLVGGWGACERHQQATKIDVHQPNTLTKYQESKNTHLFHEFLYLPRMLCRMDPPICEPRINCKV